MALGTDRRTRQPYLGRRRYRLYLLHIAKIHKRSQKFVTQKRPLGNSRQSARAIGTKIETSPANARERERESEETEYRPCRDISTPGGKIQFVSFFVEESVFSVSMAGESLVVLPEKKRGKKKGEKKIVPPLCCFGP